MNQKLNENVKVEQLTKLLGRVVHLIVILPLQFCSLGKKQKKSLIAVYTGGRLISVACCVVASGVFCDIMYYTDKQRWLRKFRYAGNCNNFMEFNCKMLR